MDEQVDSNLIFIDGAEVKDVRSVRRFLQPFVKKELLLPRTAAELTHLMKHAFIARYKKRIVGFAAVEIYSRKLAEIQCLAVDTDFQRNGIGRRLVIACVAKSKEQKVQELMAISASDAFLKECGFDYSLPMQKRALFLQPQVVDLDSN